MLYVHFEGRAKGELREVATFRVGGKTILENMIQRRKAIAYVCNGIQFVRMVEHEWSDKTGLTHVNDVGGRTDGPAALGGMTIDSLTDVFSQAIEDCARTDT